MTAKPRPELRLGLVLYGGVSLAIYMYGVVTEVLRLVRAGRGQAADDLDRAYVAALADAGFDSVMVDIVSGTSAGGINGILLAKALATGADLDVARSLWLDDGELSTLLQPTSEREPASLLRSQFFEAELRRGLKRMDERGGGVPLAEVLDLFVSGTHIRGQPLSFYDAFDNAIATKRHRRVFQLKLRRPYELAGRRAGYARNDFDPTQAPGNERLVALARTTSSFPAAFEPTLLEPGAGLLDTKLGETEGWYADGGILNNKPFTEALSTIFTRTASSPVRRWLISVDPAPETRDTDDAPGPQPDFAEIALSSVAKIPRYQSIAADLEALGAHNEQVWRAESLVLAIETALARTPVPSAVRSVLVTLGVLVPSGWAGDDAYRELRLRAVQSDIAARILAAAPASTAEDDLLVASLREAVPQATGGLENVLQLDLAFELRRLYYLIRLLAIALSSGEPEDAARLAAVRERLWAVFEAVTDALWRHLEQPGSELLTPTKPDVPRVQEVAMRIVREAAPQLIDARALAANETDGACQGTVVILPAGGPDAEPGATIEVALADVASDFELRDVQLLPLELIGDLRQRDPLRHAQVSPFTARYIGKDPRDKLCGDSLGHFGGFLERRWRENDILWGRLDAAEILIRIVMEGRPSAEVEKHIHAVQGQIVAEEVPQAGADWLEHMRTRHNVGAEGLGDLPGDRLVRLGLHTAQVTRNMLRRAGQSGEGSGQRIRARAMRAAGTLLGWILALLRWPVAAHWGKDVLWRRIVTTGLFVAFFWGLATLILGAAGVLPLADVALPAVWALVPYLVFLALWLVGQRIARVFEGRGEDGADSAAAGHGLDENGGR